MQQNISENLIILLAEDDKGHAALVKKNLWRTCIDARIIHFSTGEELLAFLNGQTHNGERVTHGKYVILLDIKMPGIGGIETLRRVKESPTAHQIPVIMLTTTNNQHEINKCYESGCSFYIVKPSDYTLYMEAIENLGKFLSLSTLVIPDVEP